MKNWFSFLDGRIIILKFHSWLYHIWSSFEWPDFVLSELLHLSSDPPGNPVISGSGKGGYFLSGATHRMKCTSSGGNPLADLTWFKNNDKVKSFFLCEYHNLVFFYRNNWSILSLQISSVIKKSDRATSSAEISIVASKTDNGAFYRCEAKNPTITTPLVDSVRLNVYCKCSQVFLF